MGASDIALMAAARPGTSIAWRWLEQDAKVASGLEAFVKVRIQPIWWSRALHGP